MTCRVGGDVTGIDEDGRGDHLVDRVAVLGRDEGGLAIPEAVDEVAAQRAFAAEPRKPREGDVRALADDALEGRAQDEDTVLLVEVDGPRHVETEMPIPVVLERGHRADEGGCEDTARRC